MLLHKTKERKLAFEKVQKCIKTSATIAQIDTTQRLFNNYVKLHNPLPQLKYMLQSGINSRRHILSKGIDDGE